MKHTAVISEEHVLWESMVIGDHNPLALQRAVFFMSEVFHLRGGEEQCNLKPSQFLHSSSPDCYTKMENGPKNKYGVNTKEKNKIVPVYANPSAHPHCLVYLLDKYFSKFPLKGKKMDIIYLRPVSKASDKGYWYECAPVGEEKKTNHSLRATGATALFSAVVPERLIWDVTGHQSNALHLYERPSLAQKEAVSEFWCKARTRLPRRCKR